MGFSLFKKTAPTGPTQSMGRQLFLFVFALYLLLGTGSLTLYYFLELNDLNKYLLDRGEESLDLIAMASIDSLILEDRAALNRITDRLLKSTDMFEYLSFKNEDGKDLVAWQGRDVLDAKGVMSFSREVKIGGENFGVISLKISSEKMRQDVLKHAFIKGFLFPGFLLVFSIGVIGWILLRMIKPIRALSDYAKSDVPTADPPPSMQFVELAALAAALPKKPLPEGAPVEAAAAAVEPEVPAAHSAEDDALAAEIAALSAPDTKPAPEETPAETPAAESAPTEVAPAETPVDATPAPIEAAPSETPSTETSVDAAPAVQDADAPVETAAAPAEEKPAENAAPDLAKELDLPEAPPPPTA